MIGSHSEPTLQESCLVRMVEPLSPKKKAPTIADSGFLTGGLGRNRTGS